MNGFFGNEHRFIVHPLDAVAFAIFAHGRERIIRQRIQSLGLDVRQRVERHRTPYSLPMNRSMPILHLAWDWHRFQEFFLGLWLPDVIQFPARGVSEPLAELRRTRMVVLACTPAHVKAESQGAIPRLTRQ